MASAAGNPTTSQALPSQTYPQHLTVMWTGLAHRYHQFLLGSQNQKEPTRSATIHRPVTPEKPKPSQTLLEALKASAATRCWPSTLGQPILGQTLLAALKTSAATKCWPATLGLPILGQTLLAALKSSSAARHWAVTLGQPIIAQPPPAKPKRSAPAHQPGIPTTTFPLRAASGGVPPRRSHLVEWAPRRHLRHRRKATQMSNSNPPVRKAEDRRLVPPAPTGPAPWWSNYQGAMTGQYALDYSPSPGGARAHHAPRLQTIYHGRAHLSSKAHLAAEFKAKNSAGTKPEMAEAMRQFHAWSKRWGVDKLLEQRLASKELKKANEASARDRKPRGRPGNRGGRTNLPAARAESSDSSEDELNFKKL